MWTQAMYLKYIQYQISKYTHLNSEASYPFRHPEIQKVSQGKQNATVIESRDENSNLCNVM